MAFLRFFKLTTPKTVGHDQRRSCASAFLFFLFHFPSSKFLDVFPHLMRRFSDQEAKVLLRWTGPRVLDTKSCVIQWTTLRCVESQLEPVPI